MRSVPKQQIEAADKLFRWRGVDMLGGKDVLAWTLKDGTPAFAIQGPDLRLETRCFGQNKWPINNRRGYADYELQRAMGFDVELERRGSWSGVRGGVGQTMSEGMVSVDELEMAMRSVLGHAIGDDDYMVHFTIMPMQGEPWNQGDKCTPYYSAKKRRTLCGTKPEGVIKVDVDASFRTGEMGRKERVPGVDFCVVAPRFRETEGGIVGEIGGDDDRIFLTHSFTLDPQVTGSPKQVAKAIQDCGGMLYPSLALSDVPASNFGPCCLFARLPVVLRSLKPYKGRTRGVQATTLYTTDAWSERMSNFLGNASATLFEQLTGTWDPSSNGHMMTLGPKRTEYAGPAEARIVSSVTQLATTLRKRRKRWRRGMTAEQIEKSSDMSAGRYPYLEAKINGILEIPDTFPLAVCPTYLESRTKTFLCAIGFNGLLLSMRVSPAMKAALRHDTSVSFNDVAQAKWDYAWMVRDVVLQWQEDKNAQMRDPTTHGWLEHIEKVDHGYIGKYGPVYRQATL